jgi:hypothetical protein
MFTPATANTQLQTPVRNVDKQLFDFLSVLYDEIRRLGFREYTYLLDDIISRKVTCLNLLQYTLLKLAVEEYLSIRSARYVLKAKAPNRPKNQLSTLHTRSHVLSAHKEYKERGGSKGLDAFITSKWYDSEKFFGKPIM